MSLRSRSTGTALFSFLLLAPALLPGQGVPKGGGFRLYARAFSVIEANRVHCEVNSIGELCTSTSSTIGGGYWPKGSPQQYVYNSGLEVAGTIDTTGNWGWAGDTTGAFFYDPKGTTQHGQEIEPVWNYANADDRAHWPEAARVPLGDVTAALYDPAVQGRPSASDGDIWTLMWEGNPLQAAGRPHPLGVAVETRGLAWDRPSGNNDIVYFVHTFYNISSTCAADYAAIRPEMRERIHLLGEQFQGANRGVNGVQFPVCGYTIRDMYVGSGIDADVSSDAGANFGSVNIPLAIGYTYHHTFHGPEGSYALPPDLASPPFTNGYGFVGVKYLKSSTVDGLAPGLRMYSGTTGGGVFNDAANTYQLYRYLSGNINPGLGDGLCNFDPIADHICYIVNDTPRDHRAWQSTGPIDLAPGGSFSLVVAYIFASAVASPGCPVANCPEVRPNDPTRLSDAALLASSGANLIDSMAGYRGYSDLNLDGKVQGNEFVTVRGSLMQKAQLAQAVFEVGFATAQPPAAPDFFLVPGDRQIAVLWRPSNSEQSGDPFFTHAADPSSPLYDPNFRQFDVEGYRIYRGRVGDPTQLTLLAQFDHGATDASGHSLTFRDYLGTVNTGGRCAPELGLNTIAEGCPVNFEDPPAVGVPYTVFREYTLGGSSSLIQVKLGDRFLTSTGSVYTTKADTAITGGGSGSPSLVQSGVTFSYIDQEVSNDLRYFYAVTAFDVNSIQSGPSSLESARILKSATPMRPGSNYDHSDATVVGLFGRGVNMRSVISVTPQLNATTGVFSGPARPATGANLFLLQSLVPQLLTEPGSMSLTLDSMLAGSPYDPTSAYATRYYFTATSATGSTQTSLSVIQSQANATVSTGGMIEGAAADPERIARYGGSGDYHLSSRYTLSYSGTYYTSTFGRGCNNGAPGFLIVRCAYNGARWFDGPTESYPHPNRGNGPTTNASTPSITNWTNAGSLAGSGVMNVWEGRSYQTRPNTYRSVEAAIGSAATAADYKVYWGAAGAVDSVIDVTHNVVVPFALNMVRGYTWGFLTQGAATVGGNSADLRTALTLSDIGCVQPIKSFPTANGHLACPVGVTYNFVNTLAFGPVAFGTTVATDGSAAVRPNPGFGMYLAGHFFMFEMNSATPTAPPAGTVWTMRSYVGAISGGGGTVGTAGNLGVYAFAPQPSPFNAVGASLTASYTVSDTIREATPSDLDRVHPVPDPFVMSNGWTSGSGGQVIKFVELPVEAIIRIYSLSGILIRVIDHNSGLLGGSADWDVRNRDGNLVASGVYFYHIEAPSGARRVGRMTVVTSR